MTERTERIIDVGDIEAIILRCGQCKAPFQLDPRNKAQQAFAMKEDEQDRFDKTCPFCGEPLSKTGRVAFKAFRDFVYYAGLAQPPLQFLLADQAARPTKPAN